VPRAGFHLEQRRLRENPLAVSSYIMGGCREDGEMHGERMCCAMEKFN